VQIAGSRAQPLGSVRAALCHGLLQISFVTEQTQSMATQEWYHR
jgi:hypothetical protein